MTQAELRRLAEERIQDAKALLDGQRWSFAYYVAGYAVESALKSCVLARMIYTGWVFQEKWKAQECLTHDFGELIVLAGLTSELNATLATNPAFVSFWNTVLLWDVSDRYRQKSPAAAEDLYKANTQDPNGVLQWLRIYW